MLRGHLGHIPNTLTAASSSVVANVATARACDSARNLVWNIAGDSRSSTCVRKRGERVGEAATGVRTRARPRSAEVHNDPRYGKGEQPMSMTKATRAFLAASCLSLMLAVP